MHAQLGQIMDKKIQKDQKSPTANSEEPGEKQGPGSKSRVLHMHPAHTTTKGVGKPPKPPLWPDLWTRPYPHPIEGSSSSSLGSKEGNLLLVFTPSCCHRSPNKALPEFLVWPLINFFCLRRPRILVSNRIRGVCLVCFRHPHCPPEGLSELDVYGLQSWS